MTIAEIKNRTAETKKELIAALKGTLKCIGKLTDDLIYKIEIKNP